MRIRRTRVGDRASVGRALLVLTACLASGSFSPLPAQDFNFLRPPLELERLLREETFSIADWRGSRAPGDRTQRAALVFNDSMVIPAKWASAPENGGVFNNEPRYEFAAYVLQKLFLDESSLVVPPTVLRAFDLSFVREQVPEQKPTFREAPHSVLVTLQYWLNGVSPENFWDEQRASTDSLYARHIANMNILTYLIRHSDANIGNFLVSLDPASPRVYSVDNGVSFGSLPSDRGVQWRRIRVPRLPAHTLDRLRQITREDLDKALGVLAEFEIIDGALVAVPPGANLDPRRGVRRRSERIQIGLTAREINGVENRIRDLLNQANRGRYSIF